MKISTYIFSLSLTLLLLYNSTRVTLTYTYYTFDPIGFIEALCENQDKPELKCNGKCQLKKVATSQKKDNNTPENILDFKELILFSEGIKTLIFNPFGYHKKRNHISYLNLYAFRKSNDCFHPPTV